MGKILLCKMVPRSHFANVSTDKKIHTTWSMQYIYIFFSMVTLRYVCCTAVFLITKKEMLLFLPMMLLTYFLFWIFYPAQYKRQNILFFKLLLYTVLVHYARQTCLAVTYLIDSLFLSFSPLQFMRLNGIWW